MSTFWTEILGNTPPATFAAAFCFALIGVLLTLLLGSTAREPMTTGSPCKFSWAYLMSDNAKRIFASLLMVLITLRFMPQLLNMELSAWNGLIVGLSWDGLAFLIKQKTSILDPKPKA